MARRTRNAIRPPAPHDGEAGDGPREFDGGARRGGAEGRADSEGGDEPGEGLGHRAARGVPVHDDEGAGERGRQEDAGEDREAGHGHGARREHERQVADREEQDEHAQSPLGGAGPLAGAVGDAAEERAEAEGGHQPAVDGRGAVVVRVGDGGDGDGAEGEADEEEGAQEGEEPR